jgi:hypothetical protein
MEEEARIILRQALGGVTGPQLWEASQSLFGKKHGVDLQVPPRTGDRETIELGNL